MVKDGSNRLREIVGGSQSKEQLAQIVRYIGPGPLPIGTRVTKKDILNGAHKRTQRTGNACPDVMDFNPVFRIEILNEEIGDGSPTNGRVTPHNCLEICGPDLLLFLSI
jgi:hypothetical protein